MWGQSTLLLFFYLGFTEMLTGASAQEITSAPLGQDLPPCKDCKVDDKWSTHTWDEYYTVAPNSVDAFSESISSSHAAATYAGGFARDYYNITIKYVTDLPTRVITINDTYSTTLSCCEPFVVAWVTFEYVPEPRTGRGFPTLSTCSPTSTYFVPDSTVIFSPASTPGFIYRSLYVPSNTCIPEGEAGVEPPSTKTIVARLVEETENAAEIETAQSQAEELPVVETATTAAAPMQQSEEEATSEPTPSAGQPDDESGEPNGASGESGRTSGKIGGEQSAEVTEAPSASATGSESDTAVPTTVTFESSGKSQPVRLLTASGILMTFLFAVVLA